MRSILLLLLFFFLKNFEGAIYTKLYAGLKIFWRIKGKTLLDWQYNQEVNS
jgi:hypothetical protein